MSRPKVFVTRGLAPEAIERIAAATDMDLWPEELPPPREALLERVAGVDGVLTLLTDRVDGELFDAAPGLRVVSNLAVGFDNVDVDEATRRGIPVGNTPGVLTESTADFAFALLLAAGRRVAEGDRFTRRGDWKTWGPSILLGRDLWGATLGVVGLGRIGAEVAKRARGFDMEVIYHSRSRAPADVEQALGVTHVQSLDELLRRADYVSLHVPLSPSTRHLIGARELGLMKPTAILVNTARGPVVDQAALATALAEGTIEAAGLDVTEEEPIPMSDPLLALDNVVLCPHIASASVETRKKMALMAADNLLAGLAGNRPPNCVNADALGL